MMWRPIAEFPDYEISDSGIVRRLTGNHKRPAGAVIKPCCSGPRLIVTLYNKGKRVSRKVHKLVAAAFMPPPPSPVHMIAHNDGDFRNNNVSNLRWATGRENLSDRIRHGTELRCETNGRAKLTRVQVLEIRRRHTKRCPINGAAALAREFGVSDVAIIKAFRGENWRYFTDPAGNEARPSP